MNKRSIVLPIGFAVAAVCCCQAQVRTLAIGEVHFANSCEMASQHSLLEAVALLHSFEFNDSKELFREIEQSDPRCVIAAWGGALATLERLGPNMPEKTLAAGWKEFEPWLARPTRTERERLYLSAVEAMYKDYRLVPGAVRWQRYIVRMDRLRRRYPADINAQMFYALALVWTAKPGGEGVQQRQRALTILNPIFKRFPNNPGAAHYIIHASDTPELASQGLDAARKYATIAPDSPHALHMPSHIFCRLGDWRNSIASNSASAEVAKQWIEEGRDGLFDEQHAVNHLEYAYLQMGEDSEAAETVHRIAALGQQRNGDPWWQVDAQIYFDLETQNWEDGLKVEPPQGAAFDESFDVFWIRVISAAHLGRAPQAREELAKFEESSGGFVKGHGWAELIRLEDLQASAWELYAEGKKEEAVSVLRKAVAYEHAHPIYYPDVLPRPSAGMLGEIYLLVGRPQAALAAFAQGLRMAPKRLNLLLGAREAAIRSHRVLLERKYTTEILHNCPQDADRSDVVIIRRNSSS